MNSSTVAALNRINRRFYDRYHESFSATRSRPWPGWDRALSPFLQPSAGGGGRQSPRTILDVGCGNGRFAVFLDSVSRGPYRYLGIDSSPKMIRQADRRLAGLQSLESSFLRRELSDADWVTDLAEHPVDLVVLFGVLHHIPSLDRRRRLLLRLGRLLVPGGFMIVSFWQFGDKERFRRRILEWSDHAGLAPETLDEGQLEPGDYLLAWGDSNPTVPNSESVPGPRRYCHYADSEEAGELTRSLDLRTVDRFESDGGGGNLNLYFVMQAAE